jgi:hypothetical protein
MAVPQAQRSCSRMQYTKARTCAGAHRHFIGSVLEGTGCEPQITIYRGRRRPYAAR